MMSTVQPTGLDSFVCLFHRKLYSRRFAISPLTNACRAAGQLAHHLISLSHLAFPPLFNRVDPFFSFYYFNDVLISFNLNTFFLYSISRGCRHVFLSR